jgi:hypothetical protein
VFFYLIDAVGPSGVGQRGLNDGRVTMDARGEVALYVTMDVSMADLARLMYGYLF